MNTETRDFDSTLIRRGTRASTYSDMAEFAQILESRPLDRLLTELPAIMGLSETKFLLARAVIRRRARSLSETDREQLSALSLEVAEGEGAQVRNRIRAVFE